MINVVIPASGMGSRFGAGMPKQFLNLSGKEILHRTISVFEKMDIINEIAIAVPSGYKGRVLKYGFAKVKYITEGGASRAESVVTALELLPKQTEIVLIHDGVRPFVDGETILQVIEAAKKHGAAVACCPVTDTIKKVNSAGVITDTPDRSHLWNAQTPQGFKFDIILDAYTQNKEILRTITDDSSLVANAVVVPSSRRNIKITTAEDMLIAKAFLEDI